MLLDFITWTADPALFTVGSREIRWYGLFFAVGFLIGYQIELRIFRRDNAPEKWADKIFIYTLIATIIGARLGHCLFYDWDHYSANPLDILKVWEGGLASHGGAIGIIVAMLIYSRRVTRLSPLWAFDRLVIPTALVGAMIRLGNLMNHEIYGLSTDASWGFKFIKNLHAWQQGAAPVFTEAVHPTQIYEALCYLLIFALLMVLFWRCNAGRRQGLIFGIFLFLVFLSRFLIEYVKDVQEEFEVGLRATVGMDMGQLLSIPFILFGLFLMIRALVLPENAPVLPPLSPKKR